MDVQDATLTAGGTGFVDVLISSDAAVTIDLANYVFAITNVGAPASALDFANPQNLNEPDITGYLFFNDSSIGITNLSPSELEGGDYSDSGNGATFNDGDSRLLARLELRHVLGPGQTSGSAISDQFRITLQDTNTYFFDINDNEIDIDPSSFDSNGVGGGTISLQAAAVPEPSSMALMGTALIAGLFGARYRRIARGEHNSCSKDARDQ